MLGKRIPAPQAKDWGLLTEVADDAAALDTLVGSYADELNAKGPLALRALKRVLNSVYDTRDRKSTRLNSVTNAQLVCRLLLDKKKKNKDINTLLRNNTI